MFLGWSSTKFQSDIHYGCLSSGAINSTTKAKDQATILWRENSSSYDSKRAIQVPSQQPTGHAVKRKRQDDETEYQYRKRLLVVGQEMAT
jgi:hypothetical protein